MQTTKGQILTFLKRNGGGTVRNRALGADDRNDAPDPSTATAITSPPRLR